MAKKVPKSRNGRIIFVDPQILDWQRRMRRYRKIKRTIRREIDLLPLESRESFWLRGNPRLEGKTPVEALKTLLIKDAKKVLVAAREHIRKYNENRPE